MTKKTPTDTIKVVVANELSNGQLKHIKKIFGEDKSIEIELDPSILGGIVISNEDKLFDGSLSGQLKRLKQHIMNS